MNELSPSPQVEALPNISLIDRLHNKWMTFAAAGAALVSSLVAPAFEDRPAYANTAVQAVIGMPFEGKWASDISVNPSFRGCRYVRYAGFGSECGDQ
jgi:hypothetical protein